MQTSTGWAELSQQRAIESLVLWALHHLHQVVIHVYKYIHVYSSKYIMCNIFSGFVILGSSLPAFGPDSPNQQ